MFNGMPALRPAGYAHSYVSVPCLPYFPSLLVIFIRCEFACGPPPAASNDTGGGSLKISHVINGRLNRLSPLNMGSKGHGVPLKLNEAIFPSGRNAAVD